MAAFLLAVGAIFVTAAACGSLAARLGLPRVIGEMAAGLLLGQSLLGHVWPRAEDYLFGAGTIDALRPISLFVVLLYLALIGAELNLRVVRDRSAALLGAVVVGVAAAVGGAALTVVSLSDLEPDGVPRWTYFVFLTGALLVTAVPVLARILDETGLMRTRLGTVTLTLSIADDFVAFSMVAIAIAVATDGSLALAVTGTAVLAALAVFGRLARGARRRLREIPAVSLAGIAALALVAGGIEELGASSLVAAFIVGALVWRSPDGTGAVPGGHLIRVLVPLYIVFAALPVDVVRLAESRLAVGIVVVTALAVVTKAAACLVAGRLLSLSRHESVGLAVLRNTRGVTELVALNLGYEAGLLSQDLYTVFFSMALLTTAASGAVAMTALSPLQRAGKLAPEAAVVARTG